MAEGMAAARLEALPLRGYILKLVLIISLGGFFELYDLFLATYIVPTLIKEGLYHLKTPNVTDMNAVATFVAMQFFGMFVGAGLLGGLPDKYGRKAIFTYALIGYSLCTLAMAFQTAPAWINFWRFWAAVGIGLEQVCIVTYTSELVASRFRGRAIALTQTISFISIPTVALVSWLLVPTSFLGLEGWRWVVIFGSIGAAAVWAIRRSLPESPIWLENNRRFKEAHDVLSAIESRVRGAGVQAAPLGKNKEQSSPPPVQSPVQLARGGPSHWQALFSPDIRGRVFMMVIVNICITVGYYGFASWVPTLLAAKGITTIKSLEYSVLMAIAAPLAPALSMLAADRIERKFQVIFTCTACAALGLAFSQQSAPAIVTLVGFLLTLNNGWMSSCYHTYQAELFPAAVRARAVGFVYSWSRFSAAFCAYVISYFLSQYGNIGVFVFITASMGVIVVTLLLFGPKTNARAAS